MHNSATSLENRWTVWVPCGCLANGRQICLNVAGFITVLLVDDGRKQNVRESLDIVRAT